MRITIWAEVTTVAGQMLNLPALSRRKMINT
jgi:hypothetical protein